MSKERPASNTMLPTSPRRLGAPADGAGLEAAGWLLPRSRGRSRRGTRGLGQELLDKGGQAAGLSLWLGAVHGRPLVVNEELGEVPLDHLQGKASLGRVLEVGEQRVCIGPVHVHLLHELELDIELRDELLDLVGRAGLLRAKLVAGEADDFEAFVVVFLVQRGQLSVLALGQASLGRHVDDQKDLAAVAVEGDGLGAVQVLRDGLVDAAQVGLGRPQRAEEVHGGRCASASERGPA
eukprot:CAMPEP_0202036918 /NCGR_PEP_ID=MMETSP0962-20130828/1853_1 /ASSEMBLY_ACC=CAM_ASM_000488 /TAXON_ID=4773 /ORGANISM="Schizochytrium aggregatum, Strain ATCC28209" /LENGTH=236 /DNA_ID=CAMNT_0048601017 /DNA_START=329 /DNA_END=1036 /DNA_ORIENTATION=+